MFGPDRRERAEPDVERDLGDVDATPAHVVEQARRQVEPGRRRGDRAGTAREHRLVADVVEGVPRVAGGIPVDVGGRG